LCFDKDKVWKLRDIEKLIIRNNDCVNAIKYAYGMVAYEYLPPKEARARRVAYMRDHGIGLYWKRK
jgi:hypothetical protein